MESSPWGINATLIPPRGIAVIAISRATPCVKWRHHVISAAAMILTGSRQSQRQRVRFAIRFMTTGHFFALPKKEARKEKEGGS